MAGVVAAGALVAGCGTSSSNASSSPNTVTATEREWKIVADHKTIKAGDITFTVTNKGTLNHELLVIRTDLPLGGIPIGADNKFNEDDPKATNVGESGEYDSGLDEDVQGEVGAGQVPAGVQHPQSLQERDAHRLHRHLNAEDINAASPTTPSLNGLRTGPKPRWRNRDDGPRSERRGSSREAAPV